MEESKPVSEWMDLLVDYTNNTPNEPRFTKDGILDTKIFYPLGNIYYNKYNFQESKLPASITIKSAQCNKDKFLSHLKDDQIRYAIAFLQIEALKTHLTKNYKSVCLTNPFLLLLHTIYPVIKNLEAIKEIIKILIENYDDYYELMTAYQYKKSDELIELLYAFLPIEEQNICSICLVTEPKKLLINPCKCATPIHSHCLIELNTYNPLDKCKVCLEKYRINEPVYFTSSGILIKQEKMKIFFPYHDLYYDPAMSSECLIKVSGMARLTMAICYLQFERVKELIQEKEILDNLSTYYFGYPGYQQTPLIALAVGNLPGNCHRKFGDNNVQYVKIFRLLLNTGKININHKDAFDKSVKDYIKENKFIHLKIVLDSYIIKEEPEKLSDKLYLLQKINELENYGIKIDKILDSNASYSDIRYNYELAKFRYIKATND